MSAPPSPDLAALLRAAAPAARLRAERRVEQNVKLVYWAVGFFLGLAPDRDGHDHEEAVAEGLMTLWRAALGWDPFAGVKFSTYAAVCLRRGLARWRWGTTGVGGRDLKVGGRPVASLDGGDASGALVAAPDPAEPALTAADFDELLAGAKLAGGRTELVLRRRYQDGRTLAEIGAELGLTRERVRQIEAQGIKALRAAFNPRVAPPPRKKFARRHCRGCGRQIPNVGCRVRCRPGKGCRAAEPPAPLFPNCKLSAGLAPALGVPDDGRPSAVDR